MEAIYFTVHPPYRTAFYRDWLILDIYDGTYYLYLPDDELNPENIINVYELVRDLYECEWEASSLKEAIDFIDSYGDNDNE